MEPPANSPQRQVLKPHEALTIGEGNGLPPPAYTAPAVYSSNLRYKDGGDDEDEDESLMDACSATINIDASFSVEGHGNFVILPVGYPRSAETGHIKDAASNGDRISDVLGGILSSLEKADATSQREQPSVLFAPSRPLTIKIDTGIKVKGSRNVICMGMSRLVKRIGDRGRMSTDNVRVGSKRRANSVSVHITS